MTPAPTRRAWSTFLASSRIKLRSTTIFSSRTITSSLQPGPTSSHTWSRNIDSSSDGTGGVNIQSGGGNRPSLPIAQGGLRLDRGPSDFDRSQRLTVLYVWDLPGPSRGFWRHSLGGWSITGITSFQSGAPFSLLQRADRNNDNNFLDRVDIGN